MCPAVAVCDLQRKCGQQAKRRAGPDQEVEGFVVNRVDIKAHGRSLEGEIYLLQMPYGML
ncbi:hypothetical protein D3C71_1267090 [compost metagenome]